VDIMKQDISRELFMEIDQLHTITNISENCSDLLGYEQDEMIGSNFYQYTVDFHENLLQFRGIIEIQLRGKKGNVRTFDVFVVPDAIGGAKMSLIDITKYKQIEESEKRFRMILENTDDVVYMYQILPERKFLYVNSAMERETGYSLEDFYHDPDLPFKIVHPEDLHVQLKKITGTTNFSEPFQARYMKKNGQYIWCEDRVIPFYNHKGKLEKIAGFSRDVSDRIALEKKLKELSFYDSLTSLFNRNYYEKQEEKLNTRDDRPIGIIICDLDNLKHINDSLGHTYGDKLLIQMGNLLKNSLQSETVARYGGDEFVILIENTTESNVKTIFTKIRKTIDEYNRTHVNLPIELSMGWAFSPHSIGYMKKTFKEADRMMYAEKYKKKRI